MQISDNPRNSTSAPDAWGAFRPVVFGEALFDHFPDGTRVLGGAPFNVAWHLQGFGARPLMITAVGRDREGEEILERMARWGMDLDGVQLHPSRPTGRVTAHTEDGEPSYDIEAEQAYDAVTVERLPRTGIMGSGDLLYHGTLALREETSSDTLGYIRDNYSLPTLVDVNLRDPWWEREDVLTRLQGTTWVKLNREEARLLGQASRTVDKDPEIVGQMIRREYAIPNLILTLGSGGSMALTSTGIFRQGATKVEGGVDTVGAGDAFSAVAALGIHHEWPVDQILVRAGDFAADICKIQGATSDDPEIYSRHRRRWGHAS